MGNKLKSYSIIATNGLAIIVGVYNHGRAAWKIHQCKKQYETRWEVYAVIEQKYKDERISVQQKLDNLGNIRLQSLEVLRSAAEFLKRAKIKNREIYEKVEISKEQLTEWETASFQALDILTGIAKGGATGVASSVGAYGLIGTFGKASTGTAISSLKGAAAHKAKLAWFGGGSIASGGGGMALGNTVLASIIVGPSVLASSFFMNRRAEEITTEVDNRIAKMDVTEQEINKQLEILNVIVQRIEELENSTIQLTNNLNEFLKQANSENFEDAFQVARMAKSLGTLLDTAIFDKFGNLV